MPKTAALKKEATAEVFSRAFKGLRKEEKLEVIRKLLKTPSLRKSRGSILLELLDNPEIREDLYDLFLIAEAKKEKGTYTPLDEFLKKKKAK